MSNIEGQNQHLAPGSRIFAEFPSYLQSEDKKNNFAPSTFPCNFLYACENCDGPLTPIALCIVCKRATSRKCLHCQRVIITDTHLSCSALIFYSKSLHRHEKGNNF